MTRKIIAPLKEQKQQVQLNKVKRAPEPSQKDDNSGKPKRACSAWIIYNTEMVRKLKEKENLSHMDAFKKSAEIWK